MNGGIETRELRFGIIDNIARAAKNLAILNPSMSATEALLKAMGDNQE